MTTPKKTVWVIALCLIFSLNLKAQTTLSGQIKDKATAENLIGANILVKGTSQGTITDLEGQFSFTADQSLPLTLVISFIGYQSQEIEVSTIQPLQILLEEGALLGEEIIVSASRRQEKALDAPASISVVEARKLAAQALINPVVSLRNLPGVDVTPQGIDHWQINLRGRNDAFQTETYFMSDYRSLIVPGQGVSILSRNALNELDLDRIEVVRGPGSALYGPGVETGVVHFLSKSPFEHSGNSFSIGTGTKANFSVAGRHAGLINEKLGYKILAHYNRANDFVLDPDDPTDAESLAAFQPQVISGLTGEVLRPTNELEDQVFNFSLSGALEYRANEKTTLTANGGFTQRRGLVRAGLGEALQDYPLFFGQLRLQSGNFFAQIYTNQTINDQEKDVLYRTGFTSITNNRANHAQAQYIWEASKDKLDITFGGEAQLISTETKGTVHGRFEDDDDFNVYSAYTQAEWTISPTLDFVLAGRMDRFTAIDETTYSPRAGFVYHPKPTQSFRATFNRAITSPSALLVFVDLPFGLTPAFDIPFIGGIQPIDYPNPLVTSSFLPGVGEYEGIDMPLSIPYNIALAGLAETLPMEVIDYLGNKATDVNGTTEGVMLLNGQAVTTLPQRDKIKSTKTNAFEIGYKGIFGGKFSLGLDVYYNERKDLIFTGAISPLVINPSLSVDLVAELNRVTDAAELEALGSSQAEVAAAFGAVGDGLVPNPLGLVEPDIAFASSQPQFVVTPSNTGKVSYFGADLSMQYYFSEALSVFANYSWLEQNFFTDEEIGLDGTGQVYALNTPENRIRVGLDYIPESKGFSYMASIRYQDEYQVEMGTIFSGILESYTIVDAGVGYNFGNGIRINVTAQNLFDNEYRVMPRMPKIGRLVLAKGIFEF